MKRKVFLILAIILFASGSIILLSLSFFETIGRITEKQMLLYAAFDILLVSLSSVFMSNFFPKRIKPARIAFGILAVWLLLGAALLLIDYFTDGAFQSLI